MARLFAVCISVLLFLTGCGSDDEDSVNSENGISSQSELVAYLSGKQYQSIEDYEVGQLCDENTGCTVAYGKLNVRFSDTEVSIQKSDTILVLPYSYVDSETFLINYSHTSTIVELDQELETITFNDITYRLVNSE